MRGKINKFAVVGALALITSAAVSEIASADPRTQAYQRIEECLHMGLEAVLSASAQPTCAPYMRGSVEDGTPIKIDAAEACRDDNDLRRLEGNAIKKLATNKETDHSVALTGIRILGAIFCDRVDLVFFTYRIL